MTEMKPPERRKYSHFPKTLASCVEPQLRPVLKAQGLATHILSQWPSIVGPSLAGRCIPEKLSFPQGKKNNGTLTIAVENGFAIELQHMQPVLLERLATYFGYMAVTRIAISHGYRPASPLPPPQKSSAKRPLIDISALNHIVDPELKDALVSFARTISD